MSGRYCLDANVFITCWHNTYPIKIFPSLWKQIAQHQSDIILIKPIYDQIIVEDQIVVKKDQIIVKKDPLTTWLRENHFFSTPIDDEIEALSLKWEEKYQITDQSKGVDQKDVTLIAYAKRKDKTVVTLEGEQKQKPLKKYKYKIPLVCSEEGVLCINFVEMIEDFGIVI